MDRQLTEAVIFAANQSLGARRVTSGTDLRNKTRVSPTSARTALLNTHSDGGACHTNGDCDRANDNAQKAKQLLDDRGV